MWKNNGLVSRHNRTICLKLFSFTLKSWDIRCLAFPYIKWSSTICTYNLISCDASVKIGPRPLPFEVLQMTRRVAPPIGLFWSTSSRDRYLYDTQPKHGTNSENQTRDLRNQDALDIRLRPHDQQVRLLPDTNKWSWNWRGRYDAWEK
jgi:hypothetical protein